MKSNPTSHNIVNPAGHAEEVRKQPYPNVDNRVMDPDGNPLIPEDAKWREEGRATNLGHAAGHASYGGDITDNVSPPAAEHDGHEAHLAAAEPRRSMSEGHLELDGNVVGAFKAVPLNAIAPHRKLLASAAKVVFVVGDTAVLATQLWRSGTLLQLAILVGLALAGTVVMIGTTCGHEVAVAQQRQRRGPIPKGALVKVRHLYDDGEAHLAYRLWVQLAIAAGTVMFVALFMFGHGRGDPSALALGYGLLGSLTVAGSAAAEAFATNEAADDLAAAKKEYGETEAKLIEFENLEAKAAASGTVASYAERAARHDALATATTVIAIANRLTDSPEVAGYVDGGYIPEAPAPPAPEEAKPSIVPPASSRSRTRRTFTLARHLEVPAEASPVDLDASRQQAAKTDITTPSLENADPDPTVRPVHGKHSGNGVKA